MLVEIVIALKDGVPCLTQHINARKVRRVSGGYMSGCCDVWLDDGDGITVYEDRHQLVKRLNAAYQSVNDGLTETAGDCLYGQR